MTSLTSQAWFWSTVVVVVALPTALLILTEVHQWLVRRNSSYSRPVLLLRNGVLPALALVLLVRQLNETDVDATWPRITATVFGFLVILFALSGANAALFGEARAGSWRERLPTIFIDLGRVIVIAIGLGLLFSWVWGTDIGGLFAAVGVTSIVIGLAVQTAVGPVIAGLFLLFEQPFQTGDWLDTSSGIGRVLEVNWRSIHLDTGNGVKIVPNAMLAASSFTNLSRVHGTTFYAAATVTFSTQDRPGAVVSTLMTVAEALPSKRAELSPRVKALGAGEYQVSVPIATPGDQSATTNQLMHRLWYAARRAGLHLDDAEITESADDADTSMHTRRVVTTFGLDDESVQEIFADGRFLVYGEGEVVQSVGSVPEAIAFITDGAVTLTTHTEDGAELVIGRLGVGDYIGLTALTRQRVLTGAVALSDTTVMSIPRETMSTVVQRNPHLARMLGDTIDLRRQAAAEARASADRLEAQSSNR